MSHLEERMWSRLHARSGRLARLIELKAPTSILAREASLIVQALAALSPEEMGAAIVRPMAVRQKNSAGLCSNIPCEHDGEIQFEGDFICEKCKEELEAVE